MTNGKRTNDDWRKLLAEQRASGMSQEHWCAAKGINLNTMRDRASRLNKQDRETKLQETPPEVATAVWAKIVPDVSEVGDKYRNSERESSCNIRIGCGKFTVYISTGFDNEALVEVLRAVSLAC
jgi:hypothetical protein